MKNSYLSMAIATGMVIFSPNFAKSSDLLDGLNDPAPTQGVKVNWSGFYVGGAIGYGNANHDLTLHDYFKDFCYDDEVVELNPFEDENYKRPAREWTLDKKIGNYGLDDVAASCEDLARTRRTPPVTTNAGYVTVPGDSREIASLDGLNSTGVVGDFRLGYDQRMGRFLVGLFGTYGLSNMDADGTNALFGDSFTLERGDDWSVGARAGILVNDSTLLYALAAYTQTEYDLTISDGEASLSQATTFDGITVGGGVEFAVTNNVFLGLEGTHTFYDEETIFDVYDADKNVGTSVNDELGETRIMGTLKIKLNSDLF